jgi:hypothetical protein
MLRALLSFLVLLCAACAEPGAASGPFTHDAYVWQRRWTPAVRQAVAAAAPLVRAWRVLGAEVEDANRVVRVDVDREALRMSGRPVVLVVRIDGSVVPDEAAVAAEIGRLVADWRTAGLALEALEIDHDCAARGLGAYGGFLTRVRALDPSLRLAITALPSWIGEPALAAVLGRVDEAVLQVHSVSDPRAGLFDPERARAWVARFAALTPVPFRVAFPTYGSRLALAGDGRVVGIESEVPRGMARTRGAEVGVAPTAVSTALTTLAEHPPPRFAGVAWYRLPVAHDGRAWSIATWRAVVEGRPLAPIVGASAERTAIAGTFDVWVTNDGEIDAPLPAEVRVDADAGCLTADAIGGYGVVVGADPPVFRLASAGTLRPGSRRSVGWVRCGAEAVEVHAHP